MNVQQYMVSCAEMDIALTVLAPSSASVRMAMISPRMGRTVLVWGFFHKLSPCYKIYRNFY